MKRACSSASSPGRPRDLVEAQLRQDGDAVEALLAVRLDVVAERLDLGARELLVDRLDLLQADDVGLRFPAASARDCRFGPGRR